MQIKNAHIKNISIKAVPLPIVDTPRINASYVTSWAGVTATGSPAAVGNYLVFTGTEYLTTDTIATNTLTNNDITYEFWLRTTGSNYGCALAKRGTGGYFTSAIEISGINLIAGHWTGGSAGYDATAPNITRDVWQHYTVTYVSNGTQKIYYNGVLQTTSNFGVEVSPRDYNIGEMWFQLFGVEPTNFGYGNALTCNFGEFRLYTRTLSDAEVAQNFTATRSRWGI